MASVPRVDSGPLSASSIAWRGSMSNASFMPLATSLYEMPRSSPVHVTFFQNAQYWSSAPSIW